MPFVGFFVFLGLIFVALLLLMAKLLGRQANQATEHLTDMNQDVLRKKDELRKLEEEAQTKANQQLDEAYEEADKIKKRAVDEGEERKIKIVEESRIEGEKIVREAMEARDAHLQELRDQMEGRAIELACDLVRKIMSTSLRADIHSKWIDELIDKGLKQLHDIPSTEQIKEASVVSAYPLTEEQKGKLCANLKEVLGKEITVTETVDADIVAGLTINLGHLVIDGSFASKLKEAALHAQTTIE